MAYKPITWGERAQFDIREAIPRAGPLPSTSSSTKEQSFPARARKNLRNPVAGTVEGKDGLPSNVAPLVYHAATQESSSRTAKERNVMKRVANYLDDRAQARYVSTSFSSSF